MGESAADRNRKRIVEHTLEGFDTAQAAIVFANTFEKIVNDKLGEGQKFRQYIGAPDTSLAITPQWDGETVLRTVWMELQDEAMAEYICSQLEKMLADHNTVHRASVKIKHRVIRGKPQPQFIGN